MASTSSTSTPAHPRGRSDARTPLALCLISGMNGISLNTPTRRPKKSESTALDVSDPCVVPRKQTKTRSASQVERATTDTIPRSFQRHASERVVQKGGMGRWLNVVTRDYVQPSKNEIKRSRSTSAVVSALFHLPKPLPNLCARRELRIGTDISPTTTWRGRPLPELLSV